MKDPRKRATADEILQHDWMKENGVASDKPLDSAIATRIKKFANLNRLKKEALKVLEQCGCRAVST
jgi:calcium-dependent protein kinase